MVLHIIRAIFLLTVVGLVVGLALTEIRDSETALEQGKSPDPNLTTRVTLIILLPTVLALLVMIGDTFWHRKNLQSLGGLFFGLLAGLALAYVLGVVVNLIGSIFTPNPQSDTYVQMARIIVGALTVYLCISFVLQTKDDFRFVVPYVEFAKQTKGSRPTLLDTSVIVDGRIADIAETRVLEGELVVPRFVLTELQAIADSADKLKRNRGRRGLDVLNKLQNSDKVDIRIHDTRARQVEEAPDVDNKLVALAELLGARVMTNDFNLSKIAQLRQVNVLNINDLANALKPVVLPGETMRVKIIKAGEEPGQGIGYLEDGTMVVAEQGRDHMNEEINLVVTSVLQTSAGRMIFGRMEGAPPPVRRTMRH